MRISDWSSDVCSSDLSELPQAALGRLVLTNPVAADGTINTLEPTSAADNHTPAKLGTSSGSAAPAASTNMEAAMGRPSRRPLTIRAQVSGANTTGRASARERGAQDVRHWVTAGPLREKTDKRQKEQQH